MGIGLQHFLGQCIGKRDKACFTRFFWTASYFTLFVHISAAIPLLLTGLLGYSLLGFSPAMLLYAGIIIILGSATPIQATLIAKEMLKKTEKGKEKPSSILGFGKEKYSR